MTKRQALQRFFKQFGTFYEEAAVPTGANAPSFPYGTYEGVSDNFGSETPMSVNWWDRSPSWLGAEEKEQEIASVIGRGGIIIPCSGGGLWIKRGEPFVRDTGDESDAMIRRKIFNLMIEFLTEV